MNTRRSFIGSSILTIGAMLSTAMAKDDESKEEPKAIAMYVETGWHFGRAWNHAGSVAHEMNRPVVFTFNGNKAIRYPDGSRKCDPLIESMFFRKGRNA